MTLKDKLKTYNFWISLVSAIILILTILGDKFNFDIDSTLILDLSTALCSVFVVLGIISVPKSKATSQDEQNKESSLTITENVSNDIKETLSNLINQSPLSINISEIFNSFIELKENITNFFNKESVENKPQEDTKNEDLNATVDESLDINLEQSQKENSIVVNEEIVKSFENSNQNTHNQASTLNLESNMMIETYQETKN